jgi:multidrug resistance protein, MATE family
LRGISHKELFLFSLPSILGSLLEPLAGVVDTAMVGKLSVTWLAVLGIATTLLNSFSWIFNFLVHASIQGVADYKAQKENSLLQERLKISLTVALGVGLFTALFMVILERPLFELTGGTEELWQDFKLYFRPRVWGHPFTVLYVTLLSLLRGLGHIRPTFYLLGLSTGMNIVLTWLFLYPLKGDLSHAALATVSANVLGVLFSFILLMRDKRVQKTFWKLKTQGQNWFSFGKNGLNLFGRSLVLTSCFFLATRLAAELGTQSLAAHQVLLQLWLLASFFTDGVAITGNILGARYYGQKQIKRTRLIFTRLIHLGGLVGLFFTLFYGLGEEFILGLFTDNIGVLNIASSIWPLIYLSQIISAIAFVYDGLIFGLEGFPYVRKHMLIGGFFFFLPLSLISLYYPQLFYVWLGLIVFNVYRAWSGMRFIKAKLVL